VKPGDHCLLQVKTPELAFALSRFPTYLRFIKQSANRSYEGSGLGLALVKELVEHRDKFQWSRFTAKDTFTVWLQTGIAHPLDQVLEVPTEELMALP